LQKNRKLTLKTRDEMTKRSV